MAFIGILLFLFPFLAVIAGFIIGLFCFIGVCLLLIGISGIIMNKLRVKQAVAKHHTANNVLNVCTIITGIVVMLLPLSFVLYGIISVLLNAK